MERFTYVTFFILSCVLVCFQVHRVLNYPTEVIVFEVANCLEALAAAVSRVCQTMAAANLPHNLLIADRGHRVFLYPNVFSQRAARGIIDEDILDTQIGPAVFEISGHMLIKTRDLYENISHQMCCRILREASVCETMLEGIINLALDTVDELPHHPCPCRFCSTKHCVDDLVGHEMTKD